MSRSYRLFLAAMATLGRLYGLVFFAIAIAFLYWASRGFLAYSNGVRAAWSQPWVCVIGLAAGIGSLWVGFHLVKDKTLARQFVVGRDRSDDLSVLVDEFSQLEDKDPAAARKLLEDYASREEATTEARRAQLRERSGQDVQAAVALRRELKDAVALNAKFRKRVLKKWRVEQRAPMLAEIDRTDREYEVEIRELDGAIERLRLR